MENGKVDASFTEEEYMLGDASKKLFKSAPVDIGN